MKNKKSAKIITVEGTDCSGKATQSYKLYERLKSEGYKVQFFSFPEYSLPTGRIIGECYLGRNDIKSFFPEGAAYVDPLVSILLYAANRREAFLKGIESELYKNDIIILDRYTTSNLGHQGGKGRTEKDREKLYDSIIKLEYEIMELPEPDVVIFLHMPYQASLELKSNRGFLDDLEKEDKHLIDAEKSYLKLVKKFGWKYIRCTKKGKYSSKKDIKSPEKISDEIYEVIKEELNHETKERKIMTRFL